MRVLPTLVLANPADDEWKEKPKDERDDGWEYTRYQRERPVAPLSSMTPVVEERDKDGERTQVGKKGDDQELDESASQ